MKHKWKHHISWIPGEPTEHFIVCDACGVEMNDENEHEDCAGEDRSQ